MSDQDPQALIEAARAEHPPATTGDYCGRCGQDWPCLPRRLAERLARANDIVSAARYWRSTQTRKGAPYQAIDHAHRCLARAVDIYETGSSNVPHGPDCECADYWAKSNIAAPGLGD